MDTDILSPRNLFQKNVRYTIPAFQRRYVWTQDKQWEPLWDDVQKIAEDYLEQRETYQGNLVKAEQNTKRHFLGAVVIQQVNTATKDLEQREVIDGQQRITTLQLLLDAVRYVFEKYGPKDAATRLSKLVVNDKDLVKDKEDHIFKLWPTRNDRDAFKHAMHDGLATDRYETSSVVLAHEYFQRQVRHWLNPDSHLHSTRAEALEAAVTTMLQMVVIDLDAQDDPQLIFETLNARGTPLLESDLVKNFVTSEAGQSGKENVWGNLDDDWWRQNYRQGRLLRPRIDALLDYWLEMRTSKEVSSGGVFKAFQDESKGQSIVDIMLQLRGDLSNYRRYEEGRRNTTEDAFHYRASVMQMGAFTPVLLSILPRSETERAGAFRALESFLIRRMMCLYTTKDYNRLVLELVGKLKKSEHAYADSIVVDFLRGQKAPSRRWPTDKDLVNNLSNLELYRQLTRGRLRLILEGIEAKCRETDLSEQADVPRNLTIEHVLPQSWEAHWPLPNNVDDEKARDERNQLIHTIGNLTLLTGKLNATVSNGPWRGKRGALKEHSVLMLNKEFMDDSNEADWDEAAIQDRSRRMAALVAEFWPGPDSRVWTEGR